MNGNDITVLPTYEVNTDRSHCLGWFVSFTAFPYMLRHNVLLRHHCNRIHFQRCACFSISLINETGQDKFPLALLMRFWCVFLFQKSRLNVHSVEVNHGAFEINAFREAFEHTAMTQLKRFQQVDEKVQI